MACLFREISHGQISRPPSDFFFFSLSPPLLANLPFRRVRFSSAIYVIKVTSFFPHYLEVLADLLLRLYQDYFLSFTAGIPKKGISFKKLTVQKKPWDPDWIQTCLIVHPCRSPARAHSLACPRAGAPSFRPDTWISLKTVS